MSDINIILAPIVLFVYNRPWHTEQTLDALKQNELADQSILYIFADGPKEDAKAEDIKKIQEVRQLLRREQWCREVHIIESYKNKGLADSIVFGVTDIVNKYGKIIVLEDDIVTSQGFLRYMNDALDFYKNEEKVFHISGYMFPVRKKLPTTFFYNTASCWGWGTWVRAWNHFNGDTNFLISSLDQKDLKSKFNLENSYDFYSQLEANKNKSLKTWAVKWYASFFLQNGYALHPYPSLTKNIGHDGNGENCVLSNHFNWETLASSITIKTIPITELEIVRRGMSDFYSEINNPTQKNISWKVKGYFRNSISKFIPKNLKHTLRKSYNKNYQERIYKEEEKKRISKLPRYVSFESDILRPQVYFADSASFIFTYEEIFEKEIYKFKCKSNNPYIIDCGANIGLSVIYFKSIFPQATIDAFEPDEKIFHHLQKNTEIFKFHNVHLFKKACWNKETILKFFSEGADGGRAAKENELQNIIEVETIRLRDFLKKKVDFLKIDIEGAENEVLHDIADKLGCVERIFVEFHSFIGQEQFLPEILSILKNAGFRLHLTSPGLVSRSPFIEITTYAGMDNQVNIYGHRG
jgi:FkbM family methyltransferase